ncbi:hypothetical protein [Neptunicella sp. SCSIO 80796]|uniref:hypothetical protein n=1 Tax=Neptunicella plasticusilytica TaxID=3117012 RepID=UPI003A4E3AC3
MKLVTAIRHKLLELKYKRNKLAIIQFVPADQCNHIIQQCLDDGWEKGRIYAGTNSWKEDGKVTLSKGFSTLDFSRDANGKGQVSGPDKAIYGLAAEYQLTASAVPQRQ